MKKSLLTVCVLFLAVAMTVPANAQGKLSLNPGVDILLPLGTFSDVQSVGFGADVMGEYALMPELNLTASLGYYTWGGKDITSVGGTTISGNSFHSIPFMVGAKYYFMPKSASVRVYGAAQLGLFFSGTTISTGGHDAVVIGGVVIIPAQPATSTTVSSTDFAFAPIVGLEYPLGPTGHLDASVRFLIISSQTNLGFRVGYKFPIGS